LGSISVRPLDPYCYYSWPLIDECRDFHPLSEHSLLQLLFSNLA
jgi:hypothetical protein